jgi:UDP-N-acetylmuramoyl-L-alanyl-D-glutamate--2,6-diaminopimelate ligase
MSDRGLANVLTGAEPAERKQLGELISRLERAGLLQGAREGGRPIGAAGIAGLSIAAVSDDSHRVRPGGLFVAIRGEQHDGHDHLGEVEASGTIAAIVERAVEGSRLPQLVVSHGRTALAEAACWWYGDPSHELGVVGVTGTDGKTTTSFMAVAALEAAGRSAGLTGTVETKVGSLRAANDAHMTTPGALELQATLRAMVQAGDRVAVVETTSHGLALQRVAGIAYDVAILTNLSPEHLELHGTMEAYRAAKLSLFERLARRGPRKEWPRAGVVNRDDAAAPLFEAVTRESGARLITYGTDPSADVRATRVGEGSQGLTIEVATADWSASLPIRMAGRFNAHNALAVIALGEALDLDHELVLQGLRDFGGVPGRMERVDAGQPFGVVIDFAHAPAALATVLDDLAPLAAARGGALIAVFGAPGERDAGKRPLMGEVAAERCRLVVLTDDDPRGEDPARIIEDIVIGAERAGKHRDRDLLVIPDRAAAIRAALERARPGDVVLLAGMGHERSMVVGSEMRPWDERGAALSALAELGYDPATTRTPAG